MAATTQNDRPDHEFADVDLRGVTFRGVMFHRATFRSCELWDVTMRGVEIANTTISGEVRNLVINGVDVAPLIEAELDRRHPDRLAFATESWVGRGMQGDPRPWHPLSLPWDEMEPTPGVPHDRAAQPSLDDALALRHDAMGLMRAVVDASLTPGWTRTGPCPTVTAGRLPVRW